MKRLVLFLLSCVILQGCFDGGNKKASPVLGITEVDTLLIKPKLKRIVRQYIKEHPSQKNLFITSFFGKNAFNLPYDNRAFYILESADLSYYGEYYGLRTPFPSSYFILDRHVVFLMSIEDHLMNQELCEKEYRKVLKDVDNNNIWVFKVTNRGDLYLVTKDLEETRKIKIQYETEKFDLSKYKNSKSN